MSSPISALFAFGLAAGCSPISADSDGIFDLIADTTPTRIEDLRCETCDGNCSLQALTYERRYHFNGRIDYTVTPPAGGPHHPCWGDFGVHDEAVDDERWVHNLEHGAIVASYACGEDCASDLDRLRAWAAGAGPWSLVTPYAESEWPFTLTAWGYRLQTDCVDEAQFTSFYAEHADHGPESTLAGTPQQCM